MHVLKHDLPVKMSLPGAVARQLPDFGDATGFGAISGECFSLAAGTDIAPLLEGLRNDVCQSPHWGYLLDGEVVVTYTDRPAETCGGGEIFYWPPGHSVRVTEDAEIIMFSPQIEHTAVLDHMLEKVGATS